MSKLYDYQVFLRRDDNGTYVAHVPALDGCHALGATPEEAQRELQNVFDMIAEEYTTAGLAFPDDVQLTVAMPAKARELMRAAERLGFVLARQKCSHARWKHPDGRSTTIPVHPSAENRGLAL